jgi:phenylacetate-CoA ligase
MLKKFYSKILESFFFRLGDLIFGDNYIGTLRDWRKISKLSEEQINIISLNNLDKILEFAVENIPFYKDLNKYSSLKPTDRIKKFPVLKKMDIMSNLESLTSVDCSFLLKGLSSGSSGIQGTVYYSSKERSIARAIQTLWWEWSGWYFGKPLLQTGMSSKRGFVKKAKDVLTRTDYYLAFGLSDIESVDIINSKKGQKGLHLGGYASSLYVLAKVANENSIKDVKFDKVISWGDKMFPHYKDEIQKAFGCSVTDTYGCSEGVMIAAQKDLDYYYIMSPHVYLELIDDDGNEVSDGELGFVVVTRLDAFSMPLIRYYTGDLAVKLPKEKYPEKRELKFPLLEKIIGRDTDIVKTNSGKYMIVHFFTGIFGSHSEIKQFKVIQKNLDGIVIEYIPSDGFIIENLVLIENIILSYIDEPFKIEWVEVVNIFPTPSGKPQIIESSLK